LCAGLIRQIWQIVAREMKNGKLFYDSYILEQESLNPTPGISPVSPVTSKCTTIGSPI